MKDWFDEFGEWAWCLHCERVEKVEAWENAKNHCPYSDCNGSPLDAWEWEIIYGYNSHFEEVPIINKKYPMYDFKEKQKRETI